MKRVLLFTAFLIISLIVNAQDIEGNRKIMESVKANRQKYLFAEAFGENLEEAKKEAVKQLGEQISITVKSETNLKMVEKTLGNEISSESVFDMAARTFSNVNLKSYTALQTGAPTKKSKHYTVFAFIGNDQVEKILMDLAAEEKAAYEERRANVLGYYESGLNSMKTLRVGDALKYFYWSYVLAKDTDFTVPVKGKEEPAQPALESLISHILDNIQVTAMDVKEEKLNEFQKSYKVKLLFTYRGKDGNEEKVTCLDFKTNSGNGWIDGLRVNDGIGYVEIGQVSNGITLHCIYKYDENETPVDVWERVKHDNKTFSAATKHCGIKATAAIPKQVAKNEKKINANLETMGKQGKMASHDHAAMAEVMGRIETAIRTKQYASVQGLFTAEGYDCFQKLFKKGNAVIVGTPTYIFLDFADLTICRSITMQFSYSNNKKFIENVAFRFNEDNRIESLAFMMPEKDQDIIISNSKLPIKSRLALLSFLEDYQTAYALGNLNYLQKVFSEDALIITGTKVKVKRNEMVFDTTYYSQQSKSEYMRKLENHFNRREYINLNFTETEFRQATNASDVFGVQMRQEYFSNVYGDVGYLFLLVDLRNEDPEIHIRAWNEDHTPVNERFSLRDVDF